MRPLLHIPDGFLAPQVALALWVVSALAVAIALRRIGANDAGARGGAAAGSAAARQTILMGISGAFVFAAQMFNFPVAAGTSGHLLGGVLAGFLLGPWAGTVVMAIVIGVQALIFQDGGLLALGANIFNMGLIGTLGGTLLARGVSTALGNGRVATLLGIAVAAWLSVMAAAGFTTLQLGLSGTTDIGIGLPAMLGVHALIGIGEALISIAAVSFIAASAPEIFARSATPSSASPLRRGLAAIAVIATTLLCASLFASTSPDGLEKIASDLGFLHKGTSSPLDLFSDYTIPGLSGPLATIVAGIVGVALVALILIVLSKIAARRS